MIGFEVKRYTLHVEARLKEHASAVWSTKMDTVKREIETFLRNYCPVLTPHSKISDMRGSLFLKSNVDSIQICELSSDMLTVSGSSTSNPSGTPTKANAVKRGTSIKTEDCSFLIHVYKFTEDEVMEEVNEEENVMISQHWTLPSQTFHRLWDKCVLVRSEGTFSVFFHITLTRTLNNRLALYKKLLNYVYTSMFFSDCGIDPSVISWNRVVLLHGPPGTGKTSLCKALAQKLSIRLSDRYSFCRLVEINAHSLFSKWFSESGKLVGKLFASIQEMLEDEDGFVCLLIDEVESLAAARKSAASGTEPSDAIRVVNALLTQIDQIRTRKNVLILTTSNITGAIDLAFVDRADIKQFIGLPTQKAVYAILLSCVQELQRCSIVTSSTALHDYRSLDLFLPQLPPSHPSSILYELAGKCVGFSGRTLRKLPFLAHAFCIADRNSVELNDFLGCLGVVINVEWSQRRQMSDG